MRLEVVWSLRVSIEYAVWGTGGIGDGIRSSELSARGDREDFVRRGDFDFDRALLSAYFVKATFLSDSFVAMRRSSRSSNSIDSVPVVGGETMISSNKDGVSFFFQSFPQNN